MTGTQLLWRRWTPEIMLALAYGPARFNRLLKLSRPGADWLISDRILSVRLRELEDGGLVTRQVDPGPPVRVTYSLTAAGQRYVPALKALQEVALAS
jgi:DNA-binding HxlR family transcriptional regulator